MRSSKVLEMLNKGRIEELKVELQDEIYAETLKKKPDAKKRYAAMKKYFSYVTSAREVCMKPCKIEYEGKDYISFTNSYTLVLTTESCGEIKLYDTSAGNYPDVTRLIHFDGEERIVDFNKVIAEAKSKGYKLKKSESFSNEYLFHYDDAYFRMALIDSAYGIINDGGEATVYHVGGSKRPMVIKNDIGVCVIMPVFLDGGPSEYAVVVEVE
jgi:hypothetical protein